MLPGTKAKLEKVIEKPFVRMTYTEAIDILKNKMQEGVKFQFPPEWGQSLQTEHEKYLSEVVCQNTSVFVTDYPKDVKSFYMKLNDDGKTVSAFDLLVPGIGELVGGSMREDRYDVLMKRIVENKLDPVAYDWYLDLRKYGSAPHGGFGLGFERYIQFVSSIENIRDSIPFPRVPGSCLL